MNTFDFNNTTTDYSGYLDFINLYHLHSKKTDTLNSLDIYNWFDANLCSPLGAILDLLQSQDVDMEFNQIESGAMRIMQKNDFLSYYGYTRRYDEFGTTIRYRKFKPNDNKLFANYVKENLLEHPEMPNISIELKMKFMEILTELFENARMHSETKSVYACGQFFPKKHEIKFSLTDSGVGFRNRINSTFQTSLKAIDAIEWALVESHSTKQNTSGGLGLSILKEFICLNSGLIQIVSDNGFYSMSKDGVSSKEYGNPFPGTMINLTFRTDDTNSYSLANKEELGDLF